MTVRLALSVAAGLVALAVIGYVVSLVGTPGRDLTVAVPTVAAAVSPVAAPAASPSAQDSAQPSTQGPPAVSPEWVAATAARAGIPEPALRAYATAQLRAPCEVGWTTLAGIGWVESQHGTHGGRPLGADGVPSSPILGPTLDGSGDVAAVPGEAGEWARAAGPMQFIPSTWARWASDGDADGVPDVQDVDDAAYAAARYLCASGSLTTGAGWAAAVFSYNHSQAYVDRVYAAAQAYASRTS